MDFGPAGAVLLLYWVIVPAVVIGLSYYLLRNAKSKKGKNKQTERIYLLIAGVLIVVLLAATYVVPNFTK